MKQVSLDDLIKEDKQKKLQNRKNKQFGARKNNRDNRPGFKPRRDRDNRNSRPQGFKRNDKRIDRQERDRPRPQNNKRISLQRRRQLINKQRRMGKNKFEKRPIKHNTETTQNVTEKQFKTLRVMGLHPDFTNQDLNNLFAAEGALEKCVIEQDNFGRSLTTAIVRYHSSQSAKNAIKNLNQHKIMNSVLTVQPYKRKPRR